MKYLTILLVAFTAGVIASPAKAKAKAAGCGFPDGPDCVSQGDNADGLEQFTDPAGTAAGCCLLPARCGNGDGGNTCVRV